MEKENKRAKNKRQIKKRKKNNKETGKIFSLSFS